MASEDTGPLSEDFLERATRGAVGVVVAGTFLCLATASWFAPSLAAYILGGTAPARSAHLGCLAVLAVCLAVTWWLTSAPQDAESPHPTLSKLSAVVRRGGLIGFAAALVASLAAQAGH